MAASLSAAPTKEITFDHSSGVLSPGGPVALGRDDVLTIHVTHTFNGCFQFLTTLTPAPVGAERSGEPLVNIDVPVRYDGKAAGITLSIKYLPGLLPERRAICEELPERDVQIPVENLAWTLGFAGAFTADSLTDPVFFLEPGTKKINGTDTAGFNVRKNSDAKDTATLGTAAMIHLYHTDPDRYRSLLGSNWAPVSFGLGVGADSKTKYLFGTSMRWDEHLYLTGGIAFGSVKRLPNTFDTGDHSFTTNANALDNLPSRNRVGVFFSVSYTFLGRNLRDANGPFMSAFSTVAGGGGGAGGAASTGIKLSALTVKPGTTLEITPTSGTFGPSSDAKSSVKLGSIPLKAPDLGAKWTDSKITVTVPSLTPGNVNVTVTKNDKAFGTTSMKVEPLTLNIVPASGKPGAKITITPAPGTNFGGPAEQSSVQFGDKPPIKSTDITDKWTATGIKDLLVPADLSPGKVKIKVLKDGEEAGTVDFEVLAP
jgi:hypothetical protein